MVKISGKNRRVYVKRWTGEWVIPPCFKPTVRHGDGLRVLGYTCTESAPPWSRRKYRSILQRQAALSGLHLCGDGFISQQDNELTQLKALTELLEDQIPPRRTVLDLPPCQVECTLSLKSRSLVEVFSQVVSYFATLQYTMSSSHLYCAPWAQKATFYIISNWFLQAGTCSSGYFFVCK